MEKIVGPLSNSVCIAFGAGCARNQADTELLFAYFRANGWRIRRRIEDADLVIVAACGFDQAIEVYSQRLLTAANGRRKKGARLLIVGCLAGVDPGGIQERFDAMAIAPKDIEKLDDVIGATVKLAQVKDSGFVQPSIRQARHCFSYWERRGEAKTKGVSLTAIKRRAFRAVGSLRLEQSMTALARVFPWIDRRRGAPPGEPLGGGYRLRIARGCLGECSYCAIRRAIGPLRSRPLDRICVEFVMARKRGYREFQLVAGDTGAYGQDIGTNICQLLRRLFAEKGRFKLTIADFHPEWFVAYEKELTELLEANAERVRFLSIAVQSGSDRILGLMRRKYTASAARESLRRLKQKCPNIFLSTHVLIGFPTESEEDFELTLALLRDVQFDRIDVFKYSDRPDTPASQMREKVPHETIKRRTQQLFERFPKETFHQSGRARKAWVHDGVDR